VAAHEYRQKFYPSQGGSFIGSGAGSIGSSSYPGGGGGGGYSGGSGGYSGGAGAGYQGGNTSTGLKTYSPYSADNDKPVTAISSSGGFGGGTKWGSSGAEPANAMSSTSNIGGSTFNITNNNNINYNYGSNITAISSEGSVPTFQDIDK